MNWHFFSGEYDVLTNGKLVPNCEHYNHVNVHDELTRTIVIMICFSNGKKLFYGTHTFKQDVDNQDIDRLTNPLTKCINSDPSLYSITTQRGF